MIRHTQWSDIVIDQHGREQDSLDDSVTQSAASLTNINFEKTKEMRLGGRTRRQPYQELMPEGNTIVNTKSYNI